MRVNTRADDDAPGDGVAKDLKSADMLSVIEKRHTYKLNTDLGYLSGDSPCQIQPSHVDGSVAATAFVDPPVAFANGKRGVVAVTSPGTLMSNGIITVTTDSLGGRMAQIEYAGRNFLYETPEAHYFGECTGNFALEKGIAAFGGFFLTFGATEHGMYYDKLFNMAHGQTIDSVWTEMSRYANPQADKITDRFEVYEPGEWYAVRYTLRAGEDFVRVNYTAHYPKDLENTAVWTCETWTPGSPTGERTATTKDALLVAPAGVNVREVDNWSWLKQFANHTPDLNIAEIERIHEWPDMGIAYVDTPWLALIDRGAAIATYSEQARASKLWSWGKDVFGTPYSSEKQPYFEPWRSPIGTTFAHGDPVQAHTEKWEEILFPMMDVDQNDVDGFRQRMEHKIAAASR